MKPPSSVPSERPGGTEMNIALRPDNTLDIDFNPLLAPWQKPTPNNVAGKGAIEEPGQAPNQVWQNRAAAPSAYENALGDALEQAFNGGAETLDEVVAALNAQGVQASDGQPWTATGFEAEMARLGA